MAYGLGTRFGSTTHYSGDNSASGWNGWLYPVLFIVLPIVAGLMLSFAFMAYGLGTRFGSTTHYSGDNSDSGWNGWLYPVLFIVLPIVAGLMVIALIGCNVYEYYQKKKRLEQYEHYSDHFYPQVNDSKPYDGNAECIDSTGYNEAQFTYNTIVGNYFPNQDQNNVPIRPMSGWVAPHI
ncbi:unnamed protein product [Oppiella nova]|uniref:Uncharacterized protein n=1 Tax=Oppiella nova TaxID=334625 RepID=A0A7R9MHF8_9ACAR|nr:unnamed protein product [Oppiella nova]CAG2177424.1 unnamed protein product [Oppiella nova]